MKPMATAMFAIALALGAPMAVAQDAAPKADKPGFDAGLAERTGADEHGMRRYVLVVLKTGPTRMPDGEARKAMFAGHMANIQRLSKAGKLALAGPFMDGGGDWRGLYIFAVEDIEEARALVATDPVIANGEMVAEYHKWFGSAATMLIGELHEKLAQKSF
ncbi:MAG TPA: YciI family protein [Thermomonas sp.]|nr:YciI family protein [Thermomonas sp.]